MKVKESKSGSVIIRIVLSHQDLRRQHDEQVSFYKEELEQTFKAKVGYLFLLSRIHTQRTLCDAKSVL